MYDSREFPDIADHLARARMAQAEAIVDTVLAVYTAMTALLVRLPGTAEEITTSVRRAWSRALA